jgi:peptidoglycan/xylan/chitin deacetylase (PgdA/CDA1 family)
LSGGAPQVCLTFDDGPDPNYTPKVLDILAAAGVRATFFVVGMAAARHPGLIRRMVRDGHEIGNHTWSHTHPRLVRRGQVTQEVVAARNALADITGQHPCYFRPPFGYLRAAMLKAAQEHDQTVVLWSLSGKDWGPMGHAAFIARRLSRTRAGDIILLHDAQRKYNRPWATLRVLPNFITGLSRVGLKPDSVGSCSATPVAPTHSASIALP